MSFVTALPKHSTSTSAAAASPVEPSQSKAPATPCPIAPSFAPPVHHNQKYQITAAAASRAVQHLIAIELAAAGIDSSDPGALEFLERLIVDCISRLAELTHEYATLSNRTSPNSQDMLAACQDRQIDIKDLKRISRENRRLRRATGLQAPKITNPPAPGKKPELLPSDSEGESGNDEPPEQGKAQRRATTASNHKASTNHPKSLRSLPAHFPALPPKHTYLRTEAPPATSTTLSSLQQKIDNAAIIQDSLRNLIQQTEATPSSRQQSDAGIGDGSMDVDTGGLDRDLTPTQDLVVPLGLGGFVNWEAASGLRKIPKAWKL